MRIVLLIMAALLMGYLGGWAACAIRDYTRREAEKTLANHAEYARHRDAQFPEMVGKWGKP